MPKLIAIIGAALATASGTLALNLQKPDAFDEIADHGPHAEVKERHEIAKKVLEADAHKSAFSDSPDIKEHPEEELTNDPPVPEPVVEEDDQNSAAKETKEKEAVEEADQEEPDVPHEEPASEAKPMDVSPTVPFALPMSHVFGTMLMPTAEDGRTPLVPNPLAPGTMIANPAPYGLVQNPTNPYQLVPAGPDHVTPMLPDPTQPNMLAPFGTLHKAAIVHPDAQGRGAYGGLYPRSVEAGLAAMYQYQTGGAALATAAHAQAAQAVQAHFALAHMANAAAMAHHNNILAQYAAMGGSLLDVHDTEHAADEDDEEDEDEDEDDEDDEDVEDEDVDDDDVGHFLDSLMRH